MGECYACMVGVATGPESHDDDCLFRNIPMPVQDGRFGAEWAEYDRMRDERESVVGRRDRPLEGMPAEDLEKLARGSAQNTPVQQHHADLTQAEAAEELRNQQEDRGR